MDFALPVARHLTKHTSLSLLHRAAAAFIMQASLGAAAASSAPEYGQLNVGAMGGFVPGADFIVSSSAT